MKLKQDKIYLKRHSAKSADRSLTTIVQTRYTDRFKAISVAISVATAITALSMPSCKPESPASRTAFIIGEDNIAALTSEEKKSISADIIKASVLISTQVSRRTRTFCSGTLVPNDLPGKPPRILTNHHCFASVSKNNKVSKSLKKNACIETYVYFGFSAQNDYRFTKIKCKNGTLRTDSVGDLAVFSLEEVPNDVTPITLWPQDSIEAGRPIYIVHYPNIVSRQRIPKGERLPVPTASVTYKDCQTQGPFPADEWNLDQILRYSMMHNCDLIHGSSGSALIDLETNTIIGVNWGGLKLQKTRGIRTNNAATKSGYIRYFLAGKSGYINPSEFNQDVADRQVSGDVRGLTNSNDKPKKNQGFLGRICGTITPSTKLNTAANSWPLLWVVIILLPIGLVLLSGQTARSISHD